MSNAVLEETLDTFDHASGPELANDEDAMHRSFLPEKLTFKNIDWLVLTWTLAMHLGCLAAPFFFSWTALTVAIVLYVLTGGIGVCLGFHRYLAHRGFTLARPVEFVVYLLGSLSAQGSPLMWVATHRLHHAKSDQPGDPHSPRDGKWWAHMLWLLVRRPRTQIEMLYRKYVPDLLDDWLLRFFDRTMGTWNVALGVVLYLVGGLPLLLWAMCARMTFVYHATWLVNSATHMFGYRNYQTRDDSRNVWWVALLTNGEGWHNNHHAFPRLARHGHRWFELDPTWWAIRLLAALRLAANVHDTLPRIDRSTTHGKIHPGDDRPSKIPSDSNAG